MNIDYTNSRFWITGGTGFLGKHIVSNLLERGVKESNIVATGKEVDLLSSKSTNWAFNEFSPDIVIHAAALCGGIGYNKHNPSSMLHTNLMLGVPLLHACFSNNIKKFVGIGTVCSYPKYTKTPFSEDDLWNGYPEETNAPYGIAKRVLMLASQCYHTEYGFNSIFVIPANLYGIGDNFNPKSSHVIPAMMLKFYNAMYRDKSPVVLWGDGSSTREFLNVKDAADGIVSATLKYNSPEPINIGTGVSISIRGLAQKIADLFGYTGEIVWNNNGMDGQPDRRLDVSRARDRFGWSANIDLDSGLKETYDWFMNSGVWNAF